MYIKIYIYNTIFMSEYIINIVLQYKKPLESIDYIPNNILVVINNSIFTKDIILY